MAIRKHPTKKGWWQIVISQGRKKPQKVYTFQGSEAEARGTEAEIRGIPLESANHKVVELANSFFDWYAIHRAPKTYTECLRSFALLIPILGDRHLSYLHQNDYDRYKTKRLDDGVCKRTINIELVYFRAFLAWCKDHNYICGAAPKLFEKKYTRPKLPVVLSKVELSKFLDKLKGDKKTIATLMAHCGLRRNEALTLNVENIDIENGLLRITGKGGKTRLMPIVGETLKSALQEAIEGKARVEYVFINKDTGQPYKNIRRTLKHTAKGVGINKRIYNHLLRHTFGAAAVSARVQQRAIQDMMGHADGRTTQMYTQVAAEVISTEALKLSAYLSEKSDLPDTNKTSD